MFYNSYKKLQPALNDVKIRNLRRLSAKIFVAIATACLRLHSHNCIKILSNIAHLQISQIWGKNSGSKSQLDQ